MQGDDTTVLAARGLVKRFGSVRAVDGIDLTIGAGDRVRAPSLPSPSPTSSW